MSHFNFSRFRIHPATVWVYCGVLQGVTDEHHEDGRLSFKEFEREMIRGVWFQSNSWVVLINCPCIISIHFVHIRWVTSWWYPLKFLLLNLRPQGRYRMVFGYHFVQNFDPGFCHLVSGPPPGTGILHWKCEFVTLQSRPFCRSLEG